MISFKLILTFSFLSYFYHKFSCQKFSKKTKIFLSWKILILIFPGAENWPPSSSLNFLQLYAGVRFCNDGHSSNVKEDMNNIPIPGLTPMENIELIHIYGGVWKHEGHTLYHRDKSISWDSRRVYKMVPFHGFIQPMFDWLIGNLPQNFCVLELVFTFSVH